MTDRNYFKLKKQVRAHYQDNEVLQLQLLHKIEFLELLDSMNPNKLSIEQAYIILDKISQKDFENLDTEILLLEKIGEADVREFSLVRTILAVILLPIILPILLIQMLAALAMAYQHMLLLQGVILTSAITLTILFLNPLFLILTAPAAMLVGHILSDLILGSMVDRMLINIKSVVCSLFYSTDGDLDQGLQQIKSIATESRYQIEGNFIVRFFKRLFGTNNRAESTVDSEIMAEDHLVDEHESCVSDTQSDETTPGAASVAQGGFFGFLFPGSSDTESEGSRPTTPVAAGPKSL